VLVLRRTMMNSDRVKEIRDRCDKASPAPWARWHGENIQSDGRSVANCGGHQQSRNCVKTDQQNKANAEFILNAREDIPWLLEYVDAYEEVEKELDRAVIKRCDLESIITAMGPTFDGAPGVIWKQRQRIAALEKMLQEVLVDYQDDYMHERIKKVINGE